MGKKDYITGRMDGLELALRIADQEGIDGIRREIAYRNNGGINTRLSMKELDEASQTIKENCVDTILIMSMYALRDEYGYGKDRMQRFYDRFMLKTDMVLDNVTNFPEIRKTLEKELGYEINKRIGITGVKLFRKKLGITVKEKKYNDENKDVAVSTCGNKNTCVRRNGKRHKKMQKGNK